jgi:hypothetical protein
LGDLVAVLEFDGEIEWVLRIASNRRRTIGREVLGGL